MSFDTLPGGILGLSAAQADAHRQLEICNACRYCEGFCSVFPAMMRQTAFSQGDLSHLSNLCHNCRGCYYSCQYAPPHEFALNLPAVLAEVRQQSWEEHIRPHGLARAFQASGLAIGLGIVLATAMLFWLMAWIGEGAGQGFYAYMAHNLMVGIFVPAFLGPLAIVGLGLRSYWRETGGRRPSIADLRDAFGSVVQMRNLAGGHGRGCNFEQDDRYSNARRYAHQAVLLGFVLCFMATASGTVLHYLFDWPAPYGLLSPPKLFGVPGGIMLMLGSVWMVRLKLRADPDLGSRRVWRGEFAFIVLLGLTAGSGLALYLASGTPLVRPMLALHLGCVMALFLLTPFSKMVHGFFRLSALVIEAQKSRART